MLEAYKLSTDIYPYATEFEVINHQFGHPNKVNLRSFLIMFKEVRALLNSSLLRMCMASTCAQPPGKAFSLSSYRSLDERCLPPCAQTSGLAFAVLIVVGVTLTFIDLVKGMAMRRRSIASASTTKAIAAADKSGSKGNNKRKVK